MSASQPRLPLQQADSDGAAQPDELPDLGEQRYWLPHDGAEQVFFPLEEPFPQQQQHQLDDFGEAVYFDPYMQEGFTATTVWVPVSCYWAQSSLDAEEGGSPLSDASAAALAQPLVGSVGWAFAAEGSSAASSSSSSLSAVPATWSPFDPAAASSERSYSLRKQEKLRCSAKDAEQLLFRLAGGGADGAEEAQAVRRAALAEVAASAWPLSLLRHGCRVVQEAVESGSTSERLMLVESLKGRILEAIQSPHANHVVQKCVTVMPPDSVTFMLEELSGHAREVARHPFGCRVLERLLEHCPPERVKGGGLFDEVLDDVPELARHPYGNYVVQHLLEHGDPEQRWRIVRALVPEARRLARHKSGSNVVQKALAHSAGDDREGLKQAIASSAAELASLESSNFGSFVVREMRRR